MRYLFVVLIPAAVGLIILLISTFIPMDASGVPAVYKSLPLVILWAPLGALGEELGWRGYLHKKLDTRMRGLFSSLLVGILWMPIHAHFFSKGLIFIFFLALAIVSYSVVIYALVQDTGFSVLLATLFHLSINLTNLLFLHVIYDTSFMMMNGIVWAVVAVIFVLMSKNVFLVKKQ
jgi:membrane protease YdiL (CAAX protease family)